MQETKEIVVIGAGLSGLCMAVKLKEAGYDDNDFAVLEKSSSVGGTWLVNTYPGCQCDVPSPVYSYSFYNYPEWDSFYPNQPQILKYIQSVVDKFQLHDVIRLQHHMRSCTWLPERGLWRLEVTYPESDGVAGRAVINARYVITASGPLQVPSYPGNMGVSNRGSCAFKGPSFHTACWDRSVDLTGKRVGVVGTGASAIQLIPAIADKVKNLYVFQRTPPWVLYKTDFRIPECCKMILRYVPFAMSSLRLVLYWAIESRFMTLISGSFLNKWLKFDLENYLKRTLPDEELRKKLTPNFEPSCKRLLFHSSYYDAYNKDNVHLISDSISKISEKGIDVVRNGKLETVELDVIVFSTGFHIDRSTNTPTPGDSGEMQEHGRRLESPNAYQLDILGENKFTSAQWTKEGPRAYLGVAAPNFPNMFFLLGPNTTLAHNSVIFMAECQVNYVIKILKKLKKEKMSRIVVRQDTISSYYDWVRKDMANKVWHNCFSWYRAPVKVADGVSVTGSHVERKGDILALWPATTCWFWYRSIFPSLDDYVVS